MRLPIVDPFRCALELWTTRNPTYQEIQNAIESGTAQPGFRVKDRHEKTLYTPLDAAFHIAEVGADNRVGNRIEEFARQDDNFRIWRKEMPPKTPAEIARYQKHFPQYDSDQVSTEISQIGRTLSEGQYVFHAGIWPGGHLDTFTTNRPLSTSLCPQVAMRNAEHRGKAYASNAIHLLALRASNPTTPVFVFRPSGTLLGHELEVLFSAGATLTRERTTLANSSYRVGSVQGPIKTVQVLVIEATIS